MGLKKPEALKDAIEADSGVASNLAPRPPSMDEVLSGRQEVPKSKRGSGRRSMGLKPKTFRVFAEDVEALRRYYSAMGTTLDAKLREWMKGELRKFSSR